MKISKMVRTVSVIGLAGAAIFIACSSAKLKKLYRDYQNETMKEISHIKNAVSEARVYVEGLSDLIRIHSAKMDNLMSHIKELEDKSAETLE